MKELIATRKAYGRALARLGEKYPKIVALDADVKNSTYALIFKEKYPRRFFDCFIAEQNMISMAIGMAKMGKIPFVSAFSAFFTRGFDQIRMAAVGKANIKLVGSHCGVSIGQDGASQMGLEDLAMMRTVCSSTVLYPADSVATGKLIEEMIKKQGICYLRTTRQKTPVIYNKQEKFPIGGIKIHAQREKSKEKRAKITIIAAGITLFEALKVQKELEGKIDVLVIDCYSIKPINKKSLLKAVNSKFIIVVEDHWFDGGLGDAVLNVFSDKLNFYIKKLAVSKMPHSGTPNENLKAAGIDANAIKEAIDKIMHTKNQTTT